MYPSSVEGDASLLGIEHSFRRGRPSHSHNHHSQHDHHDQQASLHHHDGSHASTNQLLDDENDSTNVDYDIIDVDYGISNTDSKSNDDYYDDNQDR